jgi:tRNA(Arg) A34 adenosine deaminase TadA
MKTISLLLIIFLILLVFIFEGEFFRLRKPEVLGKNWQVSLKKEAIKSLPSLDVPVAAVLLYKGDLIGKGHNSAMANKNLGEHAEINALSDAFFKLGYKNFMALTRDSLELITTLEPCLMCRGALLEYGIQHVTFLKTKGLKNALKQKGREFRYDLYRKNGKPSGLQDSLFRLHPEFRETRE